MLQPSEAGKAATHIARRGSFRRRGQQPAFRAAAACLAVLLTLQAAANASAVIDPAGGLNDTLLHQLLYRDPVEHIRILGNISDVDGALVRTFLSPAHMRAASLIRRWMREAGMLTWQDAVGNVHGRIEGPDPDAPVLLIGSHYDTVYDAGMYDGAMGIIVGIAAVKAAVLGAALRAGAVAASQLPALMADGANLHMVLEQAEAPPLLRAPVEVIAFCDEEGLRFGTTFLGSRAVAGSLVSNGLLEARDKGGRSLAEVLSGHGFDSSPAAVEAIAMPCKRLRGYVEVHMEQGPVLEELGLPLAPVAAVSGQTRLAVAIAGSQGHAGTVPMPLRRDPLAAAAEAISGLERRCGGGQYLDAKPRGFTPEVNLVCTVGFAAIWPGASNVIPGSANFSVDVRCRSDAIREAAVAGFTTDVGALCHRRGVGCQVDRVHDAPATRCDAGIIAGLAAAASASRPLLQRVLAAPASVATPALASETTAAAEQTCGAESGKRQCAAAEGNDSRGGPAGGPGLGLAAVLGAAPAAEPAAEAGKAAEAAESVTLPQLVSGAGHDALAMAGAGPMGMLFVRSRNGGISHSPLELVDDADVAAATAALLSYLHAEVV